MLRSGQGRPTLQAPAPEWDCFRPRPDGMAVSHGTARAVWCGLVGCGGDRPSKPSPMVRSESEEGRQAHMSSRIEAPGALVIPTGTTAPGRARGVPPARREGPEKLTGAAMYADDLVVPGAWFGATIRSTDPHATVRRARPRPGLRLDDGRGRDRGRHPRREHRQLDQGGPADPRPARRRDPAPRRAAARSWPRPTARPCARRRPTCASAPSGSSRVFDPLESEHVFARYTIEIGRGRRGARRRRPGPRGRVPGRPPGAALHREQRDDRDAARRRRRHRDGLAAVPVLRALGAQARPRHRRPAGAGGPGGDRRRVRRQGGVPLGHRPPRRAPRAARRAGRCG